MELLALPGYALIELPKKYKSGLTTDKEKYSKNSEGILLNICYGDESSFDDAALYNGAEDKIVYFAPYEDGEIIKENDSEYVFVPIKSLRGFKNA